VYRGWFTAPDTKRYRFHQVCNDHCDLNLGKTPDNAEDVEEILNVDHWSEYRRGGTYIAHGNQERISKWVSLEKGKKYFIQAAHLNGGWFDHFSTGVEIEQDVLNQAHPNNVKEVQKLSFATEDKRETHRITINYKENKEGKVDSGSYRIQFTNAKLEKSISEQLNANYDANTLRDKLKSYFNSVDV
jgi:hypothetical protein